MSQEKQDFASPRSFPSLPQSVACTADEGFKNWMSLYGGSLIFSTVESGKVAFLGWDGRQVTLLMRQFDYPTGIGLTHNQIAIASRRRITLFSNAKLLAYDYDIAHQGLYDACYLPRASWYVGEIKPRDILFDKKGMVFVNTRFSCLSRPSFQYHFETVWHPPFISDLVPEDRCHLSGAACVNGNLAYATALGMSDTPGGWRENKTTGGILLDVQTGKILLHSLSLPHSPRWYRECLWLLNSGAGELWVVNPRTNETKVVCSLPGFVRGLDFWTNYAIIGLSQIRKKEKNSKIPLLDKNQEALCGVAVVNILSGKLEGLFQLTQGCEEIFDLHLLPTVRRAAMLTLDKPACHEAITMENTSWWMRQEN